MQTKVREIWVDGFKVEMHHIGNASYYYPVFNGNAEFKVSSDGWKQLRRYLRMVKYFQDRIIRINFGQ